MSLYYPIFFLSVLIIPFFLIGCGSDQFSDQAESDSVMIDTNQVKAVFKQDGFEVKPDLLEPSLDSSDVQVVDPDLKPLVSLDSNVSPVSLLQSSSHETLAAEEPEVESVDDILKQLDSINLEDGSGISLGDPDKVAGLLGEGNNMINVGNIDGALAKYQEALKFADGNDDPDVRFNMGIAYKAKGKPDKAIVEYRKAIELAPNVVTVLEVDLNRYLTPPKSWIVPLVRPKNSVAHNASVINFNEALSKQNTKLDFEEEQVLRIDYFDVAGKVLASKDLLKVTKLRPNDFLPFKQPEHAAVAIRKYPMVHRHHLLSHRSVMPLSMSLTLE